MNLPSKQISKGQWLTTQLTIEPDAKVMQADFGGQARLKAGQLMVAEAGRNRLFLLSP